MNKDDAEVLLEGLIDMMTCNVMGEDQFTERQIEFIRAYKLCWMKNLPDSESLHD